MQMRHDSEDVSHFVLQPPEGTPIIECVHTDKSPE